MINKLQILGRIIIVRRRYLALQKYYDIFKHENYLSALPTTVNCTMSD